MAHALAAEHLIALGHRDVLVIGVEPPAPSTTIRPGSVTGRRLRGYREAFDRAGIDIRTTRSSSVRPASRRDRRLRRGWRAGRRPTAVLAMSDAMAIGAMRAIRDLDLLVPDDVSVVGFDDIDLARHVDPPLTTVHQPIRRKGEEAVRVLLTRSCGPMPAARALPSRPTRRARLDRPGPSRGGRRVSGRAR